jgi:hypothetical protein
MFHLPSCRTALALLIFFATGNVPLRGLTYSGVLTGSILDGAPVQVHLETTTADSGLQLTDVLLRLNGESVGLSGSTFRASAATFQTFTEALFQGDGLPLRLNLFFSFLNPAGSLLEVDVYETENLIEGRFRLRLSMGQEHAEALLYPLQPPNAEGAATGFAQWIRQFPELSDGPHGALDKPLADSLTLLEKYAFALHPARSLSAPERPSLRILPEPGNPAARRLELPLTAWLERPDLRYTIEWSTNLRDWTTLAEASGKSQFALAEDLEDSLTLQQTGHLLRLTHLPPSPTAIYRFRLDRLPSP